MFTRLVDHERVSSIAHFATELTGEARRLDVSRLNVGCHVGLPDGRVAAGRAAVALVAVPG